MTASVAGLYVPDTARIRIRSGLDQRSQNYAVPRWWPRDALQRLSWKSRRRIGGLQRRLRHCKHGRRGGVRAIEPAGSCGEGLTAGSTVLQNLSICTPTHIPARRLCDRIPHTVRRRLRSPRTRPLLETELNRSRSAEFIESTIFASELPCGQCSSRGGSEYR